MKNAWFPVPVQPDTDMLDEMLNHGSLQQVKAIWAAGIAVVSRRDSPAPASPPCDCICYFGGYWVDQCYCQNSGDLRSAAAWCAERNMLERQQAPTEEWNSDGRSERKQP